MSNITNSNPQIIHLFLLDCNLFPNLTHLVPWDLIPSLDLHNLSSRITICSLGLHNAVRENEFCKSKEQIPHRI